ncbi:hypothetical protein E4G67_00420 [Candidatus Bathyarchaeota archaeon]|nr:MAG: hypothetical protein E4G67_00420 [Candidatus Bathyarchaeota archaeon]
MLKFFRCEKCDWQFFCSEKKAKPEMMCGAVVAYVPAENPDAGNGGMIKSLGIKPLGCGGKMKEVSQEEAISYDPRK